MDEVGGFVIGYLHGAYVIRVTIRGALVEMHHRPVNADEQSFLQASLRRWAPVVVILGGDVPVRVRPHDPGPARRSGGAKRC